MDLGPLTKPLAAEMAAANIPLIQSVGNDVMREIDSFHSDGSVECACDG